LKEEMRKWHPDRWVGGVRFRLKLRNCSLWWL
jgi:hypothetical protein